MNTPANPPVAQAWLHIPIFGAFLPVAHVAGAWRIQNAVDQAHTITTLPSATAIAWLQEVKGFLDAGLISGSPRGLHFELRVRPDATLDPLALQQFALSTLDILQRHQEWNSDTTGAIGTLAFDLDLAHSAPDPEDADRPDRFRLGPPPTAPKPA